MYKEGKICSWFEDGRGSCFLNGSRCDCPFSNEGCNIQKRRIFKDLTDDAHNDYKPGREYQNELTTRGQVWENIGIKKGDFIGDWFIPYEHMDLAEDPSLMIDEAWDGITKKFADAGYPNNFIHRIFYNVKMLGTVGIYLIGFMRR